jgi:hypothetical protein
MMEPHRQGKHTMIDPRNLAHRLSLAIGVSLGVARISHASFQQKNYLTVYHILHSFFSRPDPVYITTALRARRSSA